MVMATNTRESLSMGFVKGVGLTNGKMEVYMMEISNKDVGMGTEFGNQWIKDMKAIICWIRNMDLVFMIGEMVTFMKVIIFRIKEMVMESCISKINLCIKVNGLMDKNQS